MPKNEIDRIAAEQEQFLHLRANLKVLLARSRWLRAQSAELIARSSLLRTPPR